MLVTGTVFLADDNKSVYDADVTVLATGLVAKTDVNGVFTIDVPNIDSLLSVSFANISLPKQVKARDVVGKITYIQIDPTIGPQVIVNKDYTLALIGVGVAALLGITALIIYATKSNPTPKKEEKPVKTVEA